jgi:5,10-methylenetetrahydromethanopterin reductase
MGDGANYEYGMSHDIVRNSGLD